MANTVVRTILREMDADASVRAADQKGNVGQAPKGEMVAVSKAAGCGVEK